MRPSLEEVWHARNRADLVTLAQDAQRRHWGQHKDCGLCLAVEHALGTQPRKARGLHVLVLAALGLSIAATGFGPTTGCLSGINSPFHVGGNGVNTTTGEPLP